MQVTEFKIRTNGQGKINVKITDISMNHGNKKIILVFSAKSTIYPNLYAIAEAISTPMLSIRYVLSIKPFTENPYIWYKDEGGQGNTIDMEVILFDHNGNYVIGRRTHLTLTLLYENRATVPSQDILKPTIDSKLYIDEHTGKAMIKLRIDEVSRSHQKQLFKILVSPDTSHYPMTSDISPVLSQPIEVRSKRNKRERNDVSSNEPLMNQIQRPRMSYIYITIPIK